MPDEQSIRNIRQPNKDIIFTEHDLWFFWDETWTSHGPYITELEAYWELWRYVNEMETGEVLASYQEVAPALNKSR